MKLFFTLMSTLALMLAVTPAFADCVEDADCDDANVCTADTCVEGACVNEAIDGCCLTNEDCEDGFECVDNACVEIVVECDPACDEGFECVDGVCVEVVVECDPPCGDGETCVDGVCVPDLGCLTDEDCGDGEICVENVCMPGGGDNSCVGLCGGQAPGGCFCDELCVDHNDCCEDVCAACPELSHCCEPSCDGKECGDDGCGGSCGTCDPGFKCEEFACVVCEPDCDGKICGSDGCGGTCGDCPEGESCNLEGTECLPCAGCAPWQTCDGAGGCVNPESAGDCEYGGQYIAGECYGIDWIGCCGGDVLYYCDDQSGACPLGAACLVVLDCGADNGVCTYGTEAGFFLCAEAGTTPATDPEGNLYCDFYECIPQCDGKACGPDLCGGECGQCGDGEICSETGECVVATCEGYCGEEAPAGCWCDTECEEWGDCCDDRCEFCPDMCGLDPCVDACADKCGTLGDCECGECADGKVCEANVCVDPCVPECGVAVCGDDGCNGSCGECADGEVCDAGVCIPEMVADVIDTIFCTTDDECADGEVCTDGVCEAGGDSGGGGDGDGDGGTCATGDSVPTTGLIVLFGLLGLAAIRRRRALG